MTTATASGGATPSATTTGDYETLFGGNLKGVLQWAGFEALWASLRARPEGWFVRDFSRADIPSQPMPVEEFLRFLDEAEAFLRKRHREEYCGFLYLDDPQQPTFIKVFDPRKMGSACGCGGAVSPRWTISRMPPRLSSDVDGDGSDGGPASASGRRRGWLARLFGG